MPGYQVDVTDIGLSIEDAIGMNLEREAFTRKRALPAGLELNAVEKQWFGGQQQGRNGWICQRVELNAMTAPQLVAYIEAALERLGTSKVIPPTEVIRNETRAWCLFEVARLVRQEIEAIIDADAISNDISPVLFDALKEIGQEVINEVLDEKPELSWRTVVGGQVIFEFSKRRREIEELVRRAILNAIQDRIP